MVFLGSDRLRIGGTSGEWHLLFGELADVLEGVVDLDFLACRQCRRVEMRLPAGTRPEESSLYVDTRSDREPSLAEDAQAWNPLIGPPPPEDS